MTEVEQYEAKQEYKKYIAYQNELYYKRLKRKTYKLKNKRRGYARR